jgi:hypothetical protein
MFVKGFNNFFYNFMVIILNFRFNAIGRNFFQQFLPMGIYLQTLDDVVPFSDIKDTKKFAKELREGHWQ